MSSVAHFSLAQYELMIRSGAFDGPYHQRVEFIRGEIREMTPIGVEHGAVVDRLNRLSMALLPEDQGAIRIQGALRIPELESLPEPDVLWLVPKDYFQGHPEPKDVLLLIEVSDTSLGYDTAEKARLYAEAGIADYWVVNLVDHCVEVFRDPQSTGYRTRQTRRGEEAIRPLAFPDAAVKPSSLFEP